MKTIFKEFLRLGRGKSDRSHFGGIFFDEMKIKEGLVWDARSDELVGFVDSNEHSDESGVDLASRLVTHVLQFSFKLLYAPFAYPCAYFFTKAITYKSLHQWFWEGMARLHEHGFCVLLACCDGASVNRKFIEINTGSTFAAQAKNAYGIMPVFFIQDPTNLVKKLRNNLSRSGYHSACTKLLSLHGQPLLW